MTFGEKLSRLRKEYNYTQEQLADILGISRQSISKWESDIAYPETDKLIKIGRLFECSMDYLLNEDVVEKQGLQPTEKESIGDKFKMRIQERKSKRMLFGMPLYHVGRNAHGFIAIGLKARGVFSFGLISQGIFSVGLLTIGAVSIGLLSLGMISAGVFAAGVLALGSIALGIIAAGAISIGIISFGALSIGCFSIGALAVGRYAAVGDHAYAKIAIGKTVANGTVYKHIGDTAKADISTIIQWLDTNVPTWLCWAKDIFKSFI